METGAQSSCRGFTLNRTFSFALSTNGCSHVVCLNVTLTLKRFDFLLLAEAISALSIELEHEARKAASVRITSPLAGDVINFHRSKEFTYLMIQTDEIGE